MSERDVSVMTLAQAIEYLQQLSRERYESEVRLFRGCKRVEDTGVWKESGKSFDEMLVKYDICQSDRYRSFLLAESTFDDPNLVNEIGPAAFGNAAKIANRDRREKYVEAAKMRRDTEGMPWSYQEAAEQRLKIAGSEPRDGAWNAKKNKLDELREENARLKTELRQAQAKIREQAEEIEALAKIVSGGARKTAAKSARA